MKKLTKIFSILLAVALVCTGLVLAVGANESTNETASYVTGGTEATGTLAEALVAADEKTTVTLLGDCTLEETFTVTKSVTVDLNGYELTAKADAFVIGANGVEFKIVGTGSITLAGKLVSAAAEYTGFTVEVAGTTAAEGIAINHSASNITTTYHGTWNFKNLKVVTTSVLSQGNSYFKTESGDESTAVISFYAVDFNSTAVAYQASTGNFVVSIGGTGSVTVSHSTFRTQNSGIYAANDLNGGPLTGSILIENSVISCLADTTLNNRNYVVLGMHYKFPTGIDNAQHGFNGTFNVNYSTVECNTRMFCFGSSDEPSVNVYSSTLRIAGNYGKDTAYALYRGAGSGVNTSGDTRFISVKSELNNPAVGTRANLAGLLKVSEDNKVVYDPVGDPEAPFLVVSADDTKEYPAFHKDFGFDTIAFTKNYSTTTHDGNRNLSVDNKNTGMWTSNDPFWFSATDKGGMQWDNKLGTITHVQSEQGAYVKWWLQPDPDNPTATTRKLSSGTDPKSDTYLIMGLDNKGNSTVDGYDSHPSALAGANRKSVVVAEFEFATEKDGIGYPYMQFVAQARNSSNGGENLTKPAERTFSVNTVGQITGTEKLNDQPTVMPTLNPQGEWNRISMVCYSDPAVAQYQVYVYLNGEYMGWQYLTDGDTAGDYVYFQGIRINLSNNNQKVNSNILIDNVSYRAYTNYQVEGEADGGAKYPEQYINGTPTNKFVEPSIRVVGKIFSDINEALTYATSIGAVVDIYTDMDIEATANGTINTNGYDVNVVGDSYGYVINGNYVEFNEKYQYTAYFFNGDASKLTADYVFDAADFETATVKVNGYLERDLIYTDGAVKNYTDKTIAGAQNGWATSIGATASVLPKNVTIADLEGADVNNAVYYYPSFGAIPMTYYVTDATGTTYAGDITNDQALIDFQALKGGDTFVLQADINISKAGTVFANTVDTTEQVINIDLNGHTLSLSEEGIFVNVGSYTTLNVYSSVAGGVVNCVTNNNGTLKGNYAFAINDPAVTAFSSPDLVENVKSAKINVGTIEALGTNGANMTIYAEVAFQGRVGDDDCRIVSDGVDIYSPTQATKNDAVIDTKLFNGEIYVKNALIVAVVKQNVVNITGFYNKEKVGSSTAHKPDKDADGNEIELSNRQTGFDKTVMTPYVEIDSCMLINNFAGISDGKNDNIVANNGDGSSVNTNLKFKNVVATGRMNPSNVRRSTYEGFVVVEHFDCSSSTVKVAENSAIGTYIAPMTFDALDLGIKTDNGVHTVVFSYYDTESGKMVEAVDYKLANNGTAVEGSNAYTLPMLTKGTDYKTNFVTVAWKNVAGDANVATATYIKGSKFEEKSDVKAGTYTEKLVTLTHDGTWSAAPEYVTENVDRIPGYTGAVNVTGIKANVSLYSDFDLNLYIPAEYADVLTVNGYELTDVVVDGVNYKMITVNQACNKTSENIKVTLDVKQTLRGTEYTATKVINYSVATYASNVLASAANTDADKVLVYYMAKYANAATAYMNGAEDTALAVLLAANTAYGDKYTANTSYDTAIADTKLSAVFTSATVTLDPKPAFVLTAKAGFVGTVTVKYADGTNTRVYKIDTATMRDIVIEGMKVYNFATDLEITAEGTINGEAVSVTEGSYNLVTFAKYHNDNQADPASAACLPLVNALRDYAEVAKLYMAGTLVQ